jgi:hypothetical protein
MNKVSLDVTNWLSTDNLLTASKGARAISAMNSAQADESAKPTVWYLTAFSLPATALKTSLKIS